MAEAAIRTQRDAIRATPSPRIQTLMQRRSEFGSQLEFEVEASKDHWSELEGAKGEAQRQWQFLARVRRALVLCCCNCAVARIGDLLGCGVRGVSQSQRQLECVELEEAEEESGGEETNREIFESLRRQWGGLFLSAKWGDKLELGSKIAEGGQAEIFEVEGGVEVVVKAFKKGYSLRSLQVQWPLGMPAGLIFAGTVLRDDRFAFVMQRYWGDLRKLIDARMQRRVEPPFPEPQAIAIMSQVASGMEQLHRKEIPHRDLKASNVLVAVDMTKRTPPDPRHDGTEFSCVVADYECSVGVLGTGFWRAPEILVAVRDQTLRPGLFTQQADVYSFAMTSYEILTGWVPFEELGPEGYDAVVTGRRPPLPHPMNSRVTELLCRCWHSNPAERPSFSEIGSILETVKRSYVVGDSSSSPDSNHRS